MNFLEKSMLVERWKDLSNNELYGEKNKIVDKINCLSVHSVSTKTSLKRVLEFLESYMEERGI